MPSPLSTVDPKVPLEEPPVRLNMTGTPPVINELPLASRACNVAVTELPDVTVAADKLIEL